MELYVSIDIESDGPIPGPYSMLSLGAAAYIKSDLEPTGLLCVGTYSVNLAPLPGARRCPRTMSEFWDKNPQAWAACQTDQEEPYFAMKGFIDWIKESSKKFNAKPVAVCYPAGFDFMFTYWYLINFVGESPFGFSALDMKSVAMTLLKTEYRKATKRNMPKKWFGSKGHTHVALDDALEQGDLFGNMIKELEN